MKKTIIIISLILLLSLVSVSAKEYYLMVGDKVTFEGKTITLNNVGSGGAVNIDVDGLIFTIPASATQEVGGIKIQTLETFYDSNDVSARSATLDIYNAGVVCYQDNLCEQKTIDLYRDYSISYPERNVYYYRGHSVRIERGGASDSISIEVDGIAGTLYPSWNGDPFKTVTMI